MNKGEILTIENWKNLSDEKKEFIKNFEKYKGNNDANYIDIDYLNDIPVISSKFNIYSYNGDYSKDNNFKALINYYDYLDDIFIYIKNDWNDENVRYETNEAIKELKLNYIYKEITRKTNNNWGNGICFFILKK